MSDILDRIIAVKREEVRAAEQSAPLEELRLEASSRDIRDFVGALRAKAAADKVDTTPKSFGGARPLAFPLRSGSAASVRRLWFARSGDPGNGPEPR